MCMYTATTTVMERRTNFYSGMLKTLIVQGVTAGIFHEKLQLLLGFRSSFFNCFNAKISFAAKDCMSVINAGRVFRVRVFYSARYLNFLVILLSLLILF